MGHPRHDEADLLLRLAGAAMLGFLVGSIASGTYLLLGGSYGGGLFDFPPVWAAIAFYPGFRAGYAAFEHGVDIETAKLIGVLTVGLAYALIAVVAEACWSTARRA